MGSVRSPRSESTRQREDRYRRHQQVAGQITVAMLLDLPPTAQRNRLIERVIAEAKGTPAWVLDAWEEAERHRVVAQRDRLDQAARRPRRTAAELAAEAAR